jgi:hypothetical protein
MEVKLASLPYRNATDNAEGLQIKYIYCLTNTKIYYLSSQLNIEKGGNFSGSLPSPMSNSMKYWKRLMGYPVKSV